MHTSIAITSFYRTIYSCSSMQWCSYYFLYNGGGSFGGKNSLWQPIASMQEAALSSNCKQFACGLTSSAHIDVYRKFCGSMEACSNWKDNHI